MRKVSRSDKRKSRKRRKSAADPESAKRIKKFRESLGLNQTSFARQLDIARSLVPTWENSAREPSLDMHIKLGNLSAKNARMGDAIFFWTRGGVAWEHAKPAVAAEVLRETQIAEPGRLWPVPPSKKVPEQADLQPMQVPISLLPNPQSASYVRLSDKFYAPLFKAGDTLVLDESAIDWEALEGSCVALFRANAQFEVELEQHPSMPSAVADTAASSRKSISESFGRFGVFAAWVLKDYYKENADLEVKVPNLLGYFMTDHVPSAILDESVIVLGRVIAWIPGARDSRTGQGEEKK